MKLTIECTEEQAQLLVNCLEDSFRFRMKQSSNFLDNILRELYPDKEKCDDYGEFHKRYEKWLEMRKHAVIACTALIDIIYDVFTTEQPKEANEIADMWRVIRHNIYKSNSGNDSWCVMNDEPIQLSDLPLIKCEVEL